MNFFTPEDFENTEAAKAARHTESSLKGLAQITNAKLLKEGLVVYGHIKRVGHTDVWFYENEEDSNRFPDLCIPKTHKALLICIEKIEECKHLPNQISPLNFSFESNSGFSLICKCGARVTPTAFEEIKEK